MTATRSTPPATAVTQELPADLTAGLRRLKLATIRNIAAEVMLTAKTQRWTPEELLRALLEAEIAARDASNTVNRLKAAGFPVHKTLDSFDVAASSIPAATFSYLSTLEWIGGKSNLALVGPPGTGKSHTLIALGHAAVTQGMKVKYCTATDLIEQLYRGLADNSVGKIIDNLTRNDLIIIDEVGFAPLDDTGTQLLFRLVAAAYERRSLAIASHWPFEQWGHFLPEQTTAVSILDRLLHHATVVITTGESHRMKDARNHREATTNT
jgi:DNA replication protein DnaC